MKLSRENFKKMTNTELSRLSNMISNERYRRMKETSPKTMKNSNISKMNTLNLLAERIKLNNHKKTHSKGKRDFKTKLMNNINNQLFERARPTKRRVGTHVKVKSNV
jgi:hypothetical protein